MIKIIYCITKLAGMDDADFARYWRDVHGPIGARIPGLKKLVQSNVMRDPRDRSEIVIPLIDASGKAWAVLDLDSRELDAFDQADESGLTGVLKSAALV